jgi:hypothetical protein
MAKKEIHCCLECGRDTTRDSQICKVCMPHYHRSFSKTEQIGRSAMPTDRLFNIDHADNEKPLLRHDLR